MEPCTTCKTYHYNACPVLWGGYPERPSADQIEAWKKAREAAE
jgi:hypothetical protein